jgi:hypothetical protein
VSGVVGWDFDFTEEGARHLIPFDKPTKAAVHLSFGLKRAADLAQA